jgi:hypothetical protein
MNHGRSKRVGPYLVDGYIPSENMILEFHGCMFHGCPPDTCPITKKIICGRKTNPVFWQGHNSKHSFYESRVSRLKKCGSVNIVKVTYPKRSPRLSTPLLTWYLDHGLKVGQIYRVIEYIPSNCFLPFQKCVSDVRRDGDSDSSKSLIGDTMKLIGNSAYVSMIMDKEKTPICQILQTRTESKTHDQ